MANKPKEMVVVYKREYRYPFGVLDKNLKTEDAMDKAARDFREDLENTDKENIYQMFNVICKESTRIVFTKVLKSKNKENIDREDLLEKLAMLDLENKYGKVDPEENPSLFSKQEETDDEILFTFRSDIEEEFFGSVQKWERFLSTVKNKE